MSIFGSPHVRVPVPVPVHDLFFALCADTESGMGTGTRTFTGKHAS